MQCGSSQRSLGDSTKFFSFGWWQKASASRQGHRMKTYFSENKGKRRHEKQEIGAKGDREKKRK